MRLSHSKLSTILSCPMTYYLQYKVKIEPKTTKAALSIGSAVHWGIEHSTEDLTEYFGTRQSYGRDQLLAEAMVHGYLKHEDEILASILTDDETGELVELLDIEHELFVSAKLNGKISHDFVGIIDLLILTNKGWIVIDYKTSSTIPDWNNYLEQIYRYIFLLRSAFPEVPVYKCGIINIRKTGIRQKKGENEASFLNRLKLEYDINDENYINWHMYLPEELDENVISDYINNLSKQADFAHHIDEYNLWYINYGAAKGIYGKSQYYDIFYRTPDCHVLYKIADTIYDKSTNTLLTSRDCVASDMLVIDANATKDVVYSYAEYESRILKLMTLGYSFDKANSVIEDTCIIDKSLLLMYYDTYCYKNNSKVIL